MFSRKPAPAPQRRQASTVPAKTQSMPPAQPQQSGGMLSGIGSTIAQGMAFGTGSAIAHRAVGAVAGSMSGGEAAPMEVQEQQPMEVQQQSMGPCSNDKQMFFECLKHNGGDQQSCSFLYETLQACQRNENQMSFQ